MADYIDRQALLEWFKNWSDYDEFSVGYITGIIEDAPSAVRHGKWIETEDDTIHGYCSVCGWESHLYEDDVIGMPYCPNCGARMDGE